MMNLKKKINNKISELGFDVIGQLTFIAQNGPDVALDGEEVPSAA